jgi:hypothetical protein
MFSEKSESNFGRLPVCDLQQELDTGSIYFYSFYRNLTLDLYTSIVSRFRVSGFLKLFAIVIDPRSLCANSDTAFFGMPV